MKCEVAWFSLIYANIRNESGKNDFDKLIFPRFKYVPLFEGIMGARKDYKFDSFEGRKRYFLRSIFRKIFPQIWV